jgi:DNA-binding response OmpR family regulator
MKKVLIVDDDADILEIVGLLLSTHGFRVTLLPTARDIFQTVKSVCPDVVLLDINIGGLDGRQICKQLKSKESVFNHIPVILFSAMHDLKETYPECDAIDFIPKPFDAHNLVEKIKKHTFT